MNFCNLPGTNEHLLVRPGRLFCAATGLDGPGELILRGNRIVDVGTHLTAPDARRLDFPDAVLLPGLIDLHAHPAKSGSQWGVDPDAHLLARGTTTVLSQGDAGADNFEQYLRDTIETSQTDIRLAINLSSRGDIGPQGCCTQLEWLDVEKCVAAMERHRDRIWGVSVNASHHCCGPTDPREVLRRGLEAAERAGVPLLYGLRRPEDWPLAEQLARLRPGDVVTYCYRRTPHCIVERGEVLECVRAARDRGVLFDVGHGTNSFDFTTAEAALSCGFQPDTISTDLQRAHLGESLVHDLPRVMSKLRAAGMPEQDIFRAVTIRPAEILRSAAEIGTLSVGSRADLTLLRWNPTSISLTDAFGNARSGGCWKTMAVVRDGRWNAAKG